MARILYGAPAREKIAAALIKRIKGLRRPPTLAIIQVGNRADSNAYIRQKKLFATRIGARVNHITFPKTVAERAVEKKIKILNADKSVHGIILQLPLPASLDRVKLIETVAPEKDVDGMTSSNVKHLAENNGRGFIPATARGILSLLTFYKIPILGRHVVVVGRSTLVGKPIAMLLLNEGATVTLCHRKTRNQAVITTGADILIVAAGSAGLITKNHVSKGQIVIDVGINVAKKKLEDEIGGKKLTGDVDFEKVERIVEAISPVPGGVGPMTVASLFENLVEASMRPGVRK